MPERATAVQNRDSNEMPEEVSELRSGARLILGLALVSVGLAHLSFAREAFRAQVPERLSQVLPASTDDVVLGSGIIEIGLGLALVGLPRERRRISAVASAYFVAIFPGNISQLLNHADAFGLDSDRKRLVRLLFQPVLVFWSLFAGEIL